MHRISVMQSSIRSFLHIQYFERTFGITAGNFAHGLIQPSQWWDKRPVEGLAGYKTPLENLYLCGASAHPGPGVTCIPGYNAANMVLKKE
jgi:phytoene dehydrogenase-like protein